MRYGRSDSHASSALVLILALSLAPAVGATNPASAAPTSMTPGERAFPQFLEVGPQHPDDPVILHGRLTKDGRVLADAEILLGAWPSIETRRQMPEGSTFSVEPVARAVTDGQGNYVLHAPMTPRLMVNHGAEGVDLELNVFADGRHLVWFSQATFDDRRGAWSLPAVAQADSAIANAKANPLNRLDVAFDARDSIGAPGIEEPIVGTETARHHNLWGVIGSCTDWRFLPKKTTLETVATAIATNGVTIKSTYTTSASTLSGLGFSVDGGASWSQNGTRARTSNFAGAFYDRKAPSGGTINKEYRVQWRHFVMDRHCTQSHSSYSVHGATEPDIATGGGGDYTSRYSNFSCTSTNTASWNGPRVETQTATAANYGSAFTFVPFGPASFTGTARSGYSSAVKIEYVFNSSTGGRWCGNNDVPARAQRTKAWK